MNNWKFGVLLGLGVLSLGVSTLTLAFLGLGAKRVEKEIEAVAQKAEDVKTKTQKYLIDLSNVL